MSKSEHTRWQRVRPLVVEGVERAVARWESLTGGDWLDGAPEYFLTSSVALRLGRGIPTKRRMYLESNTHEALAEARATRRGPKPKVLPARSRFDIVVGDAEGIPRVLVELKHCSRDVCDAPMSRDLHRLCHALMDAPGVSKLRRAVFASYVSGRPKKQRTATQALAKKWRIELGERIGEWSWAGRNATRYRSTLRAETNVRVHGSGDDAWAVVWVEFIRR